MKLILPVKFIPVYDSIEEYTPSFWRSLNADHSLALYEESEKFRGMHRMWYAAIPHSFDALDTMRIFHPSSVEASHHQ